MVPGGHLGFQEVVLAAPEVLSVRTVTGADNRTSLVYEHRAKTVIEPLATG